MTNNHTVYVLFSLLLMLTNVLPTYSQQRPAYGKMSSFVRQMVRTQKSVGGIHAMPRRAETQDEKPVEACVFLKVKSQPEEIFSLYNIRVLAQFGNVYIVSLPLDCIESLSADRRVERVEASSSNRIDMDTTGICVGLPPVIAGENLPQAYTGRGVLIGVQDIGFDLTHPNFYNADATRYRIRHLWDQLSPDTIGSDMYVGRTYEGQSELLELGHVVDGLEQSHGTHTAGIAAGGGYGTKYRGVAPEAELCLVANAVSSDVKFVDEADLYKYTTATDALGFKHIFDYAESLNMPCVISFSEGNRQSFNGDDLLYYEVLRHLTGPGRIIVASAGNNGEYRTYVHKPRGVESMGTFVYSHNDHVDMTVRTNDPFTMRLVAYYGPNQSDTMMVSSEKALASADSLSSDTTFINKKHYIVSVQAFRSCYDSSQICYDVTISTANQLGSPDKFSIEWIGRESDIEVFKHTAFFLEDKYNPQLNVGVSMYNLHCPSSAPDVISVGATAYRTGVRNINGEWREYNMGTEGERGDYSSVGPTLDGRIKPDVMAPGTNVISSYSSYVLEHNPDSYDLNGNVENTTFNGRTYPWVSLSGTSMSTPIVAGAIALWLEARPTLSPDEVFDILAKTSTHYTDTLEYPNIYYGYGQIDIYRGLLEVLGLNENDRIFDRVPGDVIIGPLDAHTCRLTFKQTVEESFMVEVFTQTGQKILSKQLSAGQKVYDIDLTGNPKGIYVVQVKASDKRHSGSTLIRL